eukprot:6054788-Pleurochrysis_carterae.AAC.2
MPRQPMLPRRVSAADSVRVWTCCACIREGAAHNSDLELARARCVRGGEARVALTPATERPTHRERRAGEECQNGTGAMLLWGWGAKARRCLNGMLFTRLSRLQDVEGSMWPVLEPEPIPSMRLMASAQVTSNLKRKSSEQATKRKALTPHSRLSRLGKSDHESRKQPRGSCQKVIRLCYLKKQAPLIKPRAPRLQKRRIGQMNQSSSSVLSNL